MTDTTLLEIVRDPALARKMAGCALEISAEMPDAAPLELFASVRTHPTDVARR